MAGRVFIDGAAGTTGLRIQERLAARGEIALVGLPEERRKDKDARLEAMAGADVSVLCLPDAAAAEIAAAAPAPARIIDASTAHRTAKGWVYGFPELAGRRAQICGAGRVSVPGCHASGFLALAAPLVESGALPREALLACHSLTGYSGGGKKMIAEYTDENRPAAYGAPRLYGLGMGHKHLPEMRAVAGLGKAPLFCPVVADFYSGMLVSIPLAPEALAKERRSGAALAELYADYYKNEALVKVHGAGAGPADGTLSACGMAGLDSMEIFVLGGEEQLLLCARYDNLGKGASGAAIQCLNLMLGLPETAGLVV